MATKPHDGLNWHAFAHVDKYSPDQVSWVRSKIGGREPGAADLTRFLNAPDAVAEADGNLLVTVGLSRISSLITGGGGQAFTVNSGGGIGVGTVATAATIGDTQLGGDGSSTTAWYQVTDASVGVSFSNGVITGISTFATGNANFAWGEWCWFCATPTITAGNAKSGITGFVMLNHKIASLGTKVSGATWVFTTTVTLS